MSGHKPWREIKHKSDDARRRAEEIAAELHEQFRATARRIGWAIRAGMDVPYDQLSEDAKELDRVFARWHLDAIAQAVQAERERIEAMIRKRLVYDSQRAVSWHEVQDLLDTLRAPGRE